MLKSNFIIQFSFKYNGKLVGASKTFFSSRKFDFLLGKIGNFFNEFEDEDAVKIKITLVDKINSTSKTIYRYIKINDDVRKYIQGIKDDIMGIKNIADVVLKYRVTIRNCCSVDSDFKGFQINCNDELEEVVKMLKLLFDEIIKINLDNDIIFVDSVNRSSTHRIIVHNESRSKGFSIKFPNYSSGEVRDLLIQRIKVGKNEK